MEKYTVMHSNEYLLHNVSRFITLFQNKYLKFLITTTFIHCTINFTIQTYYIIRDFSVAKFMQDAPFYFSTVYGLLTAAITVIYFRKALFEKTKRLTNLYKIDLKNSTATTRKKLSSSILKVNIIFGIFLFSATTIIILNEYFWLEYNKKYIPLLLILKESTFSESLKIKVYMAIYYINVTVLILPTVAIPMYFIYTMFYIKVRILILTDVVWKIGKKLKNYNRQNNSQYSEYIMSSLKFIIKNHLEIKRYNFDFLNSYQLLHLAYIVDGIMIGLWALFGYFSPENKRMSGLLTFTAFCLFVYCICNYVEDYMTASMELAEAIYDLDWYNWNISCQKIYLIMIVHVSKGVKVPILMLFDVGNELVKKLCRGAYALGGFLYSVRNTITL